MLQRGALFLLVIVLIPFCISCRSSGWRRGERLEILKSGSANIEVYDADASEMNGIKEAVSGMTPEVSGSVVSVSIVSDDAHFGKFPVSAHTHWERRVCLKESKFHDNNVRLMKTVWYESGHCATMLINKNTDGEFERRWSEVAGSVYYNDYSKILIIWFIPQRGLLCFEAEVNFYEDVACWYDAVMQYEALKAGRISYTPFQLENIDSGDARYIRKLGLLFEYGFITKEQYELVAPLCGK